MTGLTHLLYHVYPLRGGENMLRWNIAEVTKRAHLFNGLKAVAVATGNETLPFTALRALFPWDWTVLEVANDSQLREVSGWKALWPLVPNEPGQVFWGHAKGVTRDEQVHLREYAKTWTDLLYRTLLDFPLQVGEVLRSFPLAGSFKKTIRSFCPESKCTWHYHGGMYWVRSDLYPRTAEVLDKWFATESWPGEVVEPEQGGEVFGFPPHMASRMNLYNNTYCQMAREDYEKWKLTTIDHGQLSSAGPGPIVGTQ